MKIGNPFSWIMPKPKRASLPVRREIEVDTRRGRWTALGYRSATTATHEGRTAIRGSGEKHTEIHRESLVAMSREFMRDNGIYRGMIERAVGYVVGAGFNLQARTADPAWNVAAEALWDDWSRNPEVRGVFTWPRVERMVARELFVTGEALGLMTSGGLVQLLEPEQLCSHKFSDGLEKNKHGKTVKYHLAPYDSGGQVLKGSAVPGDPSVVLHLLDPERPSSSRATPPCQATFSMLHRINDVCDSEAAAWQMLSKLAVAITRANGSEFGRAESREDASKANSSGQASTRITEYDYAMIFNGEPGDEVRGIDRNIPGQNFPEAVTMFLRLLGLPLGMPIEATLLDWTKSNYSQSKAVLEQLYQVFRSWQSLIADGWDSRVYAWKVAEWMANGLLPLRDDSLAHEWIVPVFPWLDQLAEAQAAAEKVERSYSTHAAVCKSLGHEREEIVAQRDFEIRDAIAKANAIREETGTAVPWQLFAGIPYPGQAANVQAEAALGKREGEVER